jgi:hypothetical protein
LEQIKNKLTTQENNMQNEQSKAEQYVREKLPELMVSMNDEIEGTQGGYWEQPQLQHWLRVLGDEGHHVTVGVWIPHGYCIHVVKAITRDETLIKLNLTTGQPASEADYKAFNDIVGV